MSAANINLDVLNNDLVCRIESVQNIQTRMPPGFLVSPLLQERKNQLKTALKHCARLRDFVNLDVVKKD